MTTESSQNHRVTRPTAMKSLPSPARKDCKLRDPLTAAGAPALAASLSVRRLKTSRSIKGAQSPALFSSSSTSRKKGSDASATGGFEHTEPTSPKVTCIGQVRVKTTRNKKTKKKKRRPRRRMELARSSSTRFVEGELSLVCDELEKGDGECFRNQRWVHLHIGNFCETVKAISSELNCFYSCGRSPASSQCPPEKGKEKGPSCGAAFARWLMTVHENREEENGGGDNQLVQIVVERRGSRRELESIADELEKGGSFSSGANHGCVDNHDVSICVPPPNALLLMRCRSDPVRMAALESRFTGSPIPNIESCEEQHDTESNVLPTEEEGKQTQEAVVVGDRDAREEILLHISEKEQRDNKGDTLGRRRHSFSSANHVTRSSSFGEKESKRRFSFSSYTEPRRSSLYLESSKRRPIAAVGSNKQLDVAVVEALSSELSRAEEEVSHVKQLPDCLLLMMYQPKLSMEVSKETWVCSADFIRPKPHHQRIQHDTQLKPSDGDNNGGVEVGVPQEPAFVLAPSAPVEEVKVRSCGVLTRCKSEPVKSSAKVSPEVWFWKGRHQPVCAAGLGF